MRSGSDSTFMQVLLGLVIVTFIGLNGRTFGDRSAVVATVNGQKILETDFQRTYRSRLGMAEQRSQRTLSDVEQKELSEQVRQSMIERTVVLQEAHRLGIEVSDAEVARALNDIPSLHGQDGKFSLDLYTKFLKRQQYTRDDFEAQLRDDLLFRKTQQLMATAASLSDPAIREMFVEASTRVNLNVVRVRPTAFESAITITDADRADWLAKNEGRVKETYDRDYDRLYNHPEQVRLRMIRLAIQADGPQLGDLIPKLNTLRDQIEGGADMAELAKRWSEDPSAANGGDLGLRPVAQLSAEVSRGIDGIPAGGLSRVITTGGDVRLVRVEERVAPKVDTLDEVRNQIADDLIKSEKVPAMAADFAETQLLAKWKETGAVPEDLLNEKGLSARETGPIPTHSQNNPFAPPQEMLDDARRAKVGDVLPKVYESGGTYYVGQLVDRQEPDMAQYEARKDQIREQVLAERRVDFYEAWVADLKSQATID
jgi:peptidyl-prolyl cis-trans isomerase D